MSYITSTQERHIDILDIPALETKVAANMEKGAFGYQELLKTSWF